MLVCFFNETTFLKRKTKQHIKYIRIFKMLQLQLVFLLIRLPTISKQNDSNPIFYVGISETLSDAKKIKGLLTHFSVVSAQNQCYPWSISDANLHISVFKFFQ